MDATTRLVVGLDRAGHTVLHHQSCEVPLLFRRTGGGGRHLVLMGVNGAAGPLGGDRLQLHVSVEPGASLVVRSSGASLAQPGAGGLASIVHVAIELGDGASLRWEPEPVVSVRGSDHRSSMRVRAHPGSRAVIVETAVRGRYAEPSGRLVLHQRVEVGEAVVLDHELVLDGDAFEGPGANGPGRIVLSAVTLGVDPVDVPEPVVERGVAAATFVLGHGAVLTTASGSELARVAALGRRAVPAMV